MCSQETDHTRQMSWSACVLVHATCRAGHTSRDLHTAYCDSTPLPHSNDPAVLGLCCHVPEVGVDSAPPSASHMPPLRGDSRSAPLRNGHCTWGRTGCPGLRELDQKCNALPPLCAAPRPAVDRRRGTGGDGPVQMIRPDPRINATRLECTGRNTKPHRAIN